LRDMVSVDNDLRRRFSFVTHAGVAIIAAYAQGALSWCLRWLGCSIEPSNVAVAVRVICSLAQIEPLSLLVRLS